MMKSILKVSLTQRDGVPRAKFREFTRQLKTGLLSLKMSKTLGDVYSYTFNPVVDHHGNDISTRPTRPAQALPADKYVMHRISRCNYGFYPAPADAAEAALLKRWKQHLRLMDSDAACGAFLLNLIKRSCDDDLRSIIAGWNIPPTGGRQLLEKLSQSFACRSQDVQGIRHQVTTGLTLRHVSKHSSLQRDVQLVPPEDS
jgi:hypothetical protein